MNREQMAHVLRAACGIVNDPNILVIGSQSLLASYDEEELPDAATASMEVDLAYFDDPDDSKADMIDGAIGELSLFHESFGFYAQGVSVRTAVLPNGWRDRVVPWSTNETGQSRAAFLEPHDCVVSKLVAHRAKDKAFTEALLHARLIDSTTLRRRIDELPDDLDPRIPASLHAWLDAQQALES
ncbi:MAG: hypothetical protein M3Z25_07015 [Actinomycetota bacterium]|nr:hypothetical protein [Actinomycetota bacterium]